MKTLFLAVSLLIIVASAPVSHADTLTKYNVTAVFAEPMLGNTTTFNGSFTFNSATGQITGLTGTLYQAMAGSVVALNYQNTPSVGDGNGGVLATAYASNTTDTFYGTNNAYVILDVNAANPLSGAPNINLLAYMDCTPGGLMGRTCMSGRAGGGSMGGYPSSETVTNADPLPGLGVNGSSLAISLAAGAELGHNADWWLVAYTPWGHWYYYVYPSRWIDVGTTLNDVSPAYQGPLGNLSNLALFDITGLPGGSYVFYFGVDMAMNGVLDYGLLYYSSFPLAVP